MAIDISQLTKEQKQYIALGIMMIAIVVSVVYSLVDVGGGTAADDGSPQKTLEELQSESESLERIVRREKRLEFDFKEIQTQLSTLKKSYLPNENNKYSWVTEIVYSTAREENVQVDMVTEVLRESRPDASFSRYAVQLDLAADFDRIVRFVGGMCAQNPYLRVSYLSIRADAQDFTTHRVSVILEWPTSLKELAMPKKEGAGNHVAPIPM